jgi:TolB-like protein/class 3 adenylate cyclase/tetratricopeptide (TPR) repeat protein
MTTDDFRRKLAAILCADVAGYTRLMAGAESATHAAYKSCLNNIVAPALTTHRGRIVKSTGDGFIAVFDSVVDSLSCALAIQDGIVGKDGGSPISFRIGVNVGDVIEEDADVFGDGVNIAARLQALAAPGGVCVSAHVREQLRGKIKVEFESLGRKRVKKNDAPVEAYAVRPIDGESGRARTRGIVARMQAAKRRTWVIGLATVAMCAAVVIAWQPGTGSIGRLAGLVAGEAAPRIRPPDKPSLVVLPFKIIGAGHEQDYFADGITEDVITDLARINGLFVIARTSSFAYKARSLDIRKIGRDLGVRYALEGSVRRFNNVIRIDTQLIDAESGGHVWAERFDSPLDDIFKVQDEITRKIVTALSVNLTEREQAGRPGMHTSSMASYDAYLRGWAAFRHNTVEDYRKAIAYFQAAITFDPAFDQAHAAIAAAYLAMRMYSWTRIETSNSPVQIVLDAGRHSAELLEKARAELALALRSPSSLAYRSSAEIQIFERKYDSALEDIRKAVALDPNDAENYAMLGAALVWAGKPDAAIEPIERAMRLDPNYPALYFCHYGTALFSLGRYTKAAEKFEQCKAGNPGNLWPYIYLIASYAYLGQDAKADAARERVTELLRRQDRSLFTVKEVRNRMRYRYEADLLRLLVGLHKGHVQDSLF